MKPHDFDLLCAALAYSVIAIKNDTIAGDPAKRAAAFAIQIKEFCRATVPGAFADINTSAASKEKSEPLLLMTSMIVDLMRQNEGCGRSDLISKGFTSEEIERHWAMAKALAHVELNLLDS